MKLPELSGKVKNAPFNTYLTLYSNKKSSSLMDELFGYNHL